MPMTRDFLERGYDLPSGELRTRKVTLLATQICGYQLHSLTQVMLSKSWNLSHNLAILARVIKAKIMNNSDMIKMPLTVADLKLATKLAFFYGMEATREANERGELVSLRSFEVAGIFYTQGRVGTALERLIGNDKLPILMSGSQLAKLIMWECHCEDHHRSALDALARSRKRAWIV